MEQIADDELISVEEYLRIEEALLDERHEYVAGRLYAMVGATGRHNRIVVNTTTRLNLAALGTGCRVYSENMKLRTARDVIYYPDVVVTCDPTDNDSLMLARPCLVVEVLSPSTTTTDRREKLIAYRSLPSALTYLIIHQDQMRVERHWRENGDDDWDTEFHIEGAIPVPCPSTSLPIEQLYADL